MIKARRFKEAKNQLVVLGCWNHQCGLKSLKRSTDDKQKGKIVSDTDVHEESGDMSPPYESREGGEICNRWVLIGYDWNPAFLLHLFHCVDWGWKRVGGGVEVGQQTLFVVVDVVNIKFSRVVPAVKCKLT